MPGKMVLGFGPVSNLPIFYREASYTLGKAKRKAGKLIQ